MARLEEARKRLEEVGATTRRLQDARKELKAEKELSSELEGLRTRLRTISGTDPRPGAEEVRLSVAHLRKAVRISELGEAKRKCESKFSVAHDAAQEAAARTTALAELRTLAEAARQAMLQDTVGNINARIEDIARDAAPEFSTMALSLYRALKSGKYRDDVDVRIPARGSGTRSARETSVGEGEQISFVLALALASASSSPLLIMDEPLSGVSVEKRIRGVEALRDALRGLGKTVIFASHAEIDGCFDRVIGI